MEQRLSIVTLGVLNMGESRRFYEKGLGWKRLKASNGDVLYQLGGVVLELMPRARLMADMQVRDVDRVCSFAFTYLARSRDEVDQVLAEAVLVGAKILRPAQDAEHDAYSGYLADADGQVWRIVWKPEWLPDISSSNRPESER